ncbi:MAG: BACON domain-containing carbohydrate-binding protein [Acidobacteriota bacterium]
MSNRLKTFVDFLFNKRVLSVGVMSIIAIAAFAFFLHRVRAAETNLASETMTQANPQSPDNVWNFIDESTIVVRGARQLIPQNYRTVQLNETALRQILTQAPLERTATAERSSLALTLPMPDGSYSVFRIEESPIMEAPLAAAFPEIKTYRGQGIDDPTAITRFDFTPTGFHAQILSERGTVYIDPYAKDDTANYLTYFKADYRNDAKILQCYFTGDEKAQQSAGSEVVPNVSSGTTLRTYRLAVAASGEYTAFHGGTKPSALAAITTTVNRVNGIYERELAVRLVLVAGETNIIFTNAATDPYSNTSSDATTNQGVLDQSPPSGIGSANYDIGHIFNTGGGGLAYFGVCNASFKARGVTGSPSPVGDAFDVDYVAHEMGHQFHANHTFNGTTSNCGGGNRSASAAYEPGSGSTIMAYAGICGSQNLQPNSDDYFHVKSLQEIVSFISTTSCDVETATGNTIPTVGVGATVTIPQSTPFTLTASASDPNGDSLTYCWEEFDLGSPSPPDSDSDGSERPIFRTFNPTSNPSRTFPKLANILNNTTTIGEALPTISRTMNFQVTVRDNRVGGGGINTAIQQVVVSSAAGPFLVTQPNTAVTWQGGTLQTITWDVANTNAAPVNAANVKISLSTDGGNTFPIVILASTPNDGSELITVPNNPTSTARLKIEAVGNVFFDLSNQNFTITAGSSCSYSINPTSQNYPATGGSGSITLTTQSGCAWTAVSNDGFITITSAGSGSGSATVNYTVAANATTNQRTGTLTIAGQTFTVTQDAASGGGCTYTITPTTALFGAGSGSGSVNVVTTASCGWTATSNTSWLTITTGASGTGNGTVNYSVSTNPGSTQRIGTLTIAGQTFTVTQIGAGCVTALTPISANYTTAGGSLQLRIDAGSACSWTITNVPAWVSFASTSGTGTRKISYSVSANSGAARHADIIISGRIHAINQAGTSGGSCTYSINPTSQSFTATGGGGSATVTTQAGCNWIATSNDSWIQITSGASGSGTGVVNFTVANNPGTSSRIGTLTIAGQTFTVSQSGSTPSCSYTINPTSQSFTASGGGSSVNVTTQSGCNWTAVSNDGWLSITSGAGGTGSGIVNFSVSANSSTSSRTGTLTIAGQTFTVTQSGATPSCSYAISPTSKNVSYGQVSSAVSVTATAGCSWTAASNVSWITVNFGASGTGNGSVGYTVLANPNRVSRSGTVTIAGKTFTINQAARP